MPEEPKGGRVRGCRQGCGSLSATHADISCCSFSWRRGLLFPKQAALLTVKINISLSLSGVGGSLCPFPACLALVYDLCGAGTWGKMVLYPQVPTLIGSLPWASCVMWLGGWLGDEVISRQGWGGRSVCGDLSCQGTPRTAQGLGHRTWGDLGSQCPRHIHLRPLAQCWADQCRSFAGWSLLS